MLLRHFFLGIICIVIGSIITTSTASAQHGCALPKSLEEMRIDAKTRWMRAPSGEPKRNAYVGLVSIAVLKWSEHGLARPGNPDGLKYEKNHFYSDLYACFNTSHCGTPADKSMRDAFDKFTLAHYQGQSPELPAVIPTFPPAESVRWAENVLGCPTRSASVSSAKAPTNASGVTFTKAMHIKIRADNGHYTPGSEEDRCLKQESASCWATYQNSVQQAFPEAGGWAELGCDAGENGLCFNAGLIFRDALYSNPRDTERAWYYFGEACQNSYAAGCTMQANMALRGEGVASDQGLAIALYHRGCQLGHSEACAFRDQELGLGLSVEPNSPSYPSTVERAMSNYGLGSAPNSGQYCFMERGSNNKRYEVCVSRSYAVSRGWVKAK